MSMQAILQFFNDALVTTVLIGLIFLVSCLSFYSKQAFASLILHPYSIVRDKEYYRLLTSDLVHNDVLHLVLNEFMLYVFCSDLEESLRKSSSYGSWQFAAIYLASLLTGSVIATVRHRKDFEYSSAGPSGSIMGCMFSFMLLNPNYVALQLPVIGGVKNIYSGLLYILILILYRKKKENQMINHEVHFLGALGGMTATVILFPEIL